MGKRTLDRAVGRMRRERAMRHTLQQHPRATAAELHAAYHAEPCIYCSQQPVDPKFAPYCSAQCAVDAEHDSD